MLKLTSSALIVSASLFLSGSAWAATAANTSNGGQTPMMNNDASAPNGAMQSGAMQNGEMQQPMPTTPSANGGALKDSAEAQKQKMMQPNSGQ